MTILSELLEKVKKNPLDEQVKILCDQIWLEETKTTVKERIHEPSGPNIFLALEVPSSKRNWKKFVMLKREYPGSFVVSIREIELTYDGPGVGKISKQIDRNVKACNGNTTEKILIEFAERYKFEKGEA